MGIPDIWWYHHKVEILVYAAGFSSLHRGSKLKYHHLIVIEDKLIRKLVVFCSTDLLSSAFLSCFGFVFLSPEHMIARTLNSFFSKQGRRMRCPEPCCLPSMTRGFRCVILCLAFPHVLTIYFVFPSRFICSDYKVSMSCQQLCQHDFYFLFYSSSCPWGLIQVRCWHMTHRLCDWPVQCLQWSAAVIYR